MRSLLTRRLRLRPHGQTALMSTNGDTRPPKIALTAAEDNLFSFLEYIQKLYTPTTQLRVAGGWVRDKLRGAESQDIDIALDNIRGKRFARYVNKFQKERNLPASSVGVVKANSDKSKHLEVATVTIEGSTIDLVHLRAEEYSDGSRVPEVTFATPEDDASRRDLTINAMFFNLHTRQVEDFTGNGIQDLEDGVIRTPLEPVQTFLDDPLRVLRALRFACEFGFQLDTDLVDAVMTERRIVGAMRRKVSRERIGIEVRKMLSGKDPARAFKMLADFDLLELVFNDAPGRLGEGEHVDVAGNDFQYVPREWTEPIQQRAFRFLSYLQQSRLAIANCQIGNVEATAAIFTPLILSTLPVITPDNDPNLSPPSGDPGMAFGGIAEKDIIESALGFLHRRETLLKTLDTVEVVEMLKVHVKWPKPAGKKVALVLEAILTYPEVQQNTQDTERTGVKHWLQRYMWMTQYKDVVAPALTILTADRNSEAASDDEAQEDILRAHLNLAASYNTDAQSRRVDGKVVQTKLGRDAKQNIARALRVLQVWEMVHPDGSEDEELAFLDRLAPQLS